MDISALEKLPVQPMLAGHALFQLLPAGARQAISETGEVRHARAGSQVDVSGEVWLVAEGALAQLSPAGSVCVCLTSAGGVGGWEHGFSPASGPQSVTAILDTRYVTVPARALTEAIGEPWMEHVYARLALGRLKLVEQEMACLVGHPVSRRLANWLLRLAPMSGGEGLNITQSILAQMMGVQRTSVNASAQALRRDGLIRFARGRVKIADHAALAEHACGCGLRTAPAVPTSAVA